jgi:hypothetical protein
MTKYKANPASLNQQEQAELKGYFQAWQAEKTRQQEQMQTFGKYGLEMAKNDDPEVAQRGLDILNQINKMTPGNFPIPKNFSSPAVGKEWIENVQQTMKDQREGRLTPKQAMGELMIARSKAQGKGQEKEADDLIKGEAAIEKASVEKEPTTAYGDFARGYKAELKAKNPGMTNEQRDLATADEAEKRGINKSVIVAQASGEARGKAYADERFYSMYDKKKGETVKVKGYAVNADDSDRYIDPQDPNLVANKQSLVATTKAMDSVNAFEKGASQALDYSMSIAKDYRAGKIPKFNSIAQLFKYNIGNEKIKGLKNSITTAATEYMKVVNAGTGLTAAELSIMGQNRAKEIIESSDNLDSLQNSIKIMKREMQISGDKFKAQRLEIQGRLEGEGSSHGAIVRTGMGKKGTPSEGKKAIQYEDGTIEYVDQ